MCDKGLQATADDFAALFRESADSSYSNLIPMLNTGIIAGIYCLNQSQSPENSVYYNNSFTNVVQKTHKRLVWLLTPLSVSASILLPITVSVTTGRNGRGLWPRLLLSKMLLERRAYLL